MNGRMIRKDLARNKIVTLTLFCFILIASLLVSGAVRTFTAALAVAMMDAMC